jgi:ferrochelatase
MTREPNDRTAVLLMAYGGPDSLDDVEPFLLDVRGGRPTPPELVEEIRARYAALGGRSPLLEISRAQAAGLERRLNHETPHDSESDPGARFRTFVGMRHWAPYIHDTVTEIADAGYTELVALCLAPHYSRLSIGAYLARLGDAVETQRARGQVLDVTAVESWGDHPLFLDAVARKVREALARRPEDERSRVEILFTAHSLPAEVVEDGDPYERQLLATAEGVARLLAAGGSPPRWSFCYQSAGASSIPWLGPALEEVIPERAAAGCKDLLVAPIGFVSDHVEILYDLDVEAREIARGHGVRLERTESLNTDPGFLAALAAVVREHLGRGRPADTRETPRPEVLRV